MKLVKSCILTLLVLSIVIQAIASAKYFEERADLDTLVDRIADRSLPPSEQAKLIVQFLRSKPFDTNDSYFLLPFFSVFRATPRQVAEKGGDCADRSRFVIRLLGLRGIESSKWALYSRDQQPQHAVVEVKTEKGDMVVDPLFGLWFPRPEGGYHGIKGLKANPRILRERISELLARGEQPGSGRLEFYPMDLYIYDHARTINWDKSPVMRVLYPTLKLVLGKSVDDIARPGFVEVPELLAIFVIGISQSSVLVGWALFVGTLKRKNAGTVLR